MRQAEVMLLSQVQSPMNQTRMSEENLSSDSCDLGTLYSTGVFDTLVSLQVLLFLC